MINEPQFGVEPITEEEKRRFMKFDTDALHRITEQGRVTMQEIVHKSELVPQVTNDKVVIAPKGRIVWDFESNAYPADMFKPSKNPYSFGMEMTFEESAYLKLYLSCFTNRRTMTEFDKLYQERQMTKRLMKFLKPPVSAPVTTLWTSCAYPMGVPVPERRYFDPLDFRDPYVWASKMAMRYDGDFLRAARHNAWLKLRLNSEY